MADNWKQEISNILSEMKEVAEKLPNFLYALYNKVKGTLTEENKGEIIPLFTRSITWLKWLHEYCEWLESIFNEGNIQIFATHLPPREWLGKIDTEIMFLDAIYGNQAFYRQLAIAYLGRAYPRDYFRLAIYRGVIEILTILEEAGIEPVERFAEKPPTKYMTEEELEREAEKVKGDELMYLFEQAINVFTAAFGDKRGYEGFIERLKDDFKRALETESILLLREVQETLTTLKNALPMEMRERHKTLFEHLFGLLSEAEKRFIKPLLKFKFILSRLFGG